MCGASSSQTNLANEQAAYYQTVTQQAQEEFGMASDVYKEIQSVYGPIFQAGPNQMGFSQGELNTLNSSAATGVGQAFNSANQAMKENLATEGGGNSMLPSGAAEKAEQGITTAGAEQLAGEENQIEQAGYQQGYNEFQAATNALMGSTSLFGTANEGANVATGAGSAANTTMNDIAQENASPFDAVMGALGGIAGGITTGVEHCWIAAAHFGGWNDPRTSLVREYLWGKWINEHWYAPVVLWLYDKFGRRIARSKQLVKMLAPLFDKALAKAREI